MLRPDKFLINVLNHESTHYYTPIATTPEHIINSQVPILDAILQEINNNLNLSLQLHGELDAFNSSNYPIAYDLVVKFMQNHNLPDEQHAFAYQPLCGKPILTGKGEVKKVTTKQPICYKFAVELLGKYIGDIFLIPIISITVASLSKKNTGRKIVQFETLIIGIDQRSRKKRKLPPDTIVVKGQLEEVETEYFIFLTNESLENPELCDDLSQEIRETIKKWGNQTKK